MHFEEVLKYKDAESVSVKEWSPDMCKYSDAQLYTYERKGRNTAPGPKRPNSVEHVWAGTAELDSFAAGIALKRAGFCPVVLNMANEYNCGGGWCDKRGSQEEALFRVSTLPLSLWPHRRVKDNRFGQYDQHLTRAEAFYPWTECGVIYSPEVHILRDASGPLDEQVSPLFRNRILIARDLDW